MSQYRSPKLVQEKEETPDGKDPVTVWLLSAQMLGRLS